MRGGDESTGLMCLSAETARRSITWIDHKLVSSLALCRSCSLEQITPVSLRECQHGNLPAKCGVRSHSVQSQIAVALCVAVAVAVVGVDDAAAAAAAVVIAVVIVVVAAVRTRQHHRYRHQHNNPGPECRTNLIYLVLAEDAFFFEGCLRQNYMYLSYPRRTRWANQASMPRRFSASRYCGRTSDNSSCITSFQAATSVHI